jgi:hypothetical protein
MPLKTRNVSGLDAKAMAPISDASKVASPMVIYHILANQAGGAVKSVVVDHSFRVVDVVAVLRAAGSTGDAITVRKGTTAITNSMSTAVAANTVVRPTTIDVAQVNFNAGDTLAVFKADGANDPAVDVYVIGVRS